MRHFALAPLTALLSLFFTAAALAQTPGPPTNLTAIVRFALPMDIVGLQWEPPQGPVTGYIVEIGTAPGGTDTLVRQISAPANSFTASLPPGSYFARVRAVNGGNTSPPSNEVSFSLQCRQMWDPGATNISWRPLDGNRVQIVWATNGAPITSWQVRVFDIDRMLVFAGAPEPATRRSITVTLPRGPYSVVIRGVLQGCGDTIAPSVGISVGETPTSGPIVINEFDGFVELRNTTNAAVDVSGWWLLAAPSPDPNSVRAAALPAATVIAPGCTYLLAPTQTVLGVEADQIMTRMGAGYAIVNAGGRIIDSAAQVPTMLSAPMPLGEGTLLAPIPFGSYARIGNQDTNDNTADFVHLVTPTPANVAACRLDVAPSAPRNFTARVDAQTVTLSWLAPTSGGVPTAYRIEAGTMPGAANAGVFDVPASVTGLVFTGVPNGTFYVRVRAMNTFGVSIASEEATVIICTVGCTPGQVTNLAFQVNGRNVTLTWQGPPGATGYVVEVGSSSGLSNIGRFLTGPVPSITAVGVPPGVYYVRVRALNGDLVGPPSNDVVIVVL